MIMLMPVDILVSPGHRSLKTETHENPSMHVLFPYFIYRYSKQQLLTAVTDVFWITVEGLNTNK
jgi:hypothetical protein